MSQAGEQIIPEALTALQSTNSRLTEFLLSPDTFLLSQLDMLSSSRETHSERDDSQKV